MKYALVHLADIHYRPNEPEGVSTIMRAFLDDLEKQRRALQHYAHYIAITGDFVYAGGNPSAYSGLKQELDGALSDIGFPKEVRIAVPGNHDMDQEVVKRDPCGYQAELTNCKDKERSLNDFLIANAGKEQRFANYHTFESAFAKFGTASSTPGKGWKVADDLGLFCLNTALCSSAGIDATSDEKHLAIGTRCLTEWCNNVSSSANVLLMHHPVDHLNDWSCQELKRLIDQYFCLCLCGHSHKQDVYHNRISQKTLVVSAPQLFTSKEDTLGYSIVLLENGSVDRIIYRQYVDGEFLVGSQFSRSDDGIVSILSIDRTNRERLELALKKALSSYRGQPDVFVTPTLTKEREPTTGENMLPELISNPSSYLVLAQPQFGQTCLCHYMRLEAYKRGTLWAYVDAKHTKARKVLDAIEEDLHSFGISPNDVDCILLDSWDGNMIDHVNTLKTLDAEFPETPILLMINYTEANFSSDFDFSKLKHEFSITHLQTLQRAGVRELVNKYSEAKNLPSGDAVVTKVVRDLAALNVHRTPINCLTLLRVLEKDMNEEIVNRTRLIKTVLFILFTDAESFTYAGSKPDVDDCEYILGRFCKTLIEQTRRGFTYQELVTELRTYCQEKLISVDVKIVVDILESNSILLRLGDFLEFKHSYWIFYFAATYMLHDNEFSDWVLSNRVYVNFPEIIEFYTGYDGRRVDAVERLLEDTESLVTTVDQKIGIPEDFNPYVGIVWNPSDEAVEIMRKEVSEKVGKSNLPTEIKDRHADEDYDSVAPYDQSIRRFLNEYSVISLMQAIRAASRGLRNSKYVNPDLKLGMLKVILRGWASMARVVFVLSPTLAQRGRAAYDGFGLILDKSFEGSYQKKLRDILLAGPFNVVRYLKEDLTSGKIGPLVSKVLTSDVPELQKHFLAHFLIRERPEGWYHASFEYMNLLHRNSFYLGDLAGVVNSELRLGFTTKEERQQLKQLAEIVVAKHVEGPRKRIGGTERIPAGQTINEKNRLPIDKIRAAGKRIRGDSAGHGAEGAQQSLEGDVLKVDPEE